MERKKSWYGYIFLAFSAILTGMILSAGMGSVGTFYLYGNYKKVLAALATLVLFFAVWILLRAVARSELPAFFRENDKRARILTAAAAALILLGALSAQLYTLNRLPELSSLGGKLPAYQDAALGLLMGNADGMQELMSRSGLYGYGKVLSLLYGFSGTFPAAAVFLGLFFFGVNLFLIYGVGSRMLGRGAGLTALFVYAFLPGHIGLASAPGSAGLGYPSFYTAVLLGALLCFLKADAREAGDRAKGLLYAAASGILTGYACFLSPATWGVLAATVLWLLLNRRFRQAFLAAALCAGMFFLLQYGRACDLGTGMGDVLGAYAGEAGMTLTAYGGTVREYINESSLRFEVIWGREIFAGFLFSRRGDELFYSVNPWYHQLSYLLLLSFVLLALVLSWKRRKDGPYLPVMAGMGAVLLLSSWGFHEEADAAAFYALFVLAAGCGVQLLYEDLREREEEEERKEAAEIRELKERLSREEENKTPPRSGIEAAPGKEPERDVMEKEESPEKSLKSEAKRPVRFIENPLPVPKKHVPKVMEFDIREIENPQYDIEVSDQDDYDL